MADDGDQGPKRRGRPAGKRGTFSFRVTADLRSRLEADAERSGRPVSEEIERRLEESYRLPEIISIVQKVAFKSATDTWFELQKNGVGGDLNFRVGYTFADIICGMQINADNLGGDRNWTRDRVKALVEEKGASEMIPSLLAQFPFPDPADGGSHPDEIRREEANERSATARQRKGMRPEQA